MLILSIECTAGPVSCALIEDGRLKAELYLDVKTTHSQTLLPMVEQALSLCSKQMKEIDYIAVTKGPGSFTGVRIGVSAVKGLAEPLNIPCVPVSVLHAMAYNMIGSDAYVCAVMDARCNQVYNALFKVSGETVERLCDDRALMIDELKAELVEIQNKDNRPIIVVGDGAELFYGKAGDIQSLKLAPMHLVRQKASSVGMVALKHIEDGKIVTAEQLLPQYLRLPQAERELKAKQASKG